MQLKIAGADLGRYEHETYSNNFLISPADRVVIEAMFDNAGSYTLTHTQPDKELTLARFIVNEENQVLTNFTDSFFSPRHNGEVINEFPGFRRLHNSPPDKSLRLTVELAGQEIDHSQHVHAGAEDEDHDHGPHVMENTGLSTDYQITTPAAEALKTLQWDDPHQSDLSNVTPDIFWKLVEEDTGKISMDIDNWVFKQGDLAKLRLVNDTNADHVMQHPIHIHGQQFVVLSVDNQPNNNLVWKDTTLVFPGQTMDLPVRMSNTGEWMLHCHISEHLHAGMMMKFRVEDSEGKAEGDAYRTTLLEHSHLH